MASIRMTRNPDPARDSYATPDWLYRALDLEFRITLDPCPLNSNWTKGVDVDGLEIDWTGTVYCNPPYSNIEPWVRKGLASSAITVFLLPVRTDTMWFRLLMDAKAEIRWLRKRVCFVKSDGKKQHTAENSLIAVVRDGIRP